MGPAYRLPAYHGHITRGDRTGTSPFHTETPQGGHSYSDSGIAAEDGSYTGYKISGTDLTIQDSGTYIVSGSCADGSITVKKGTTGVTLVLDGLTLTSSDTAPIACNKSSEVTIVAASGTTNTLTDSAQSNDDSYPDNENTENAVIKCKDGSDVTICGSGTLNITANGKNGIKSGATQPYVIFGSIGGMGRGPMGGGTSALAAKGSSFSIQDNSGSTVYSGTALCSANYVFFSSSKLSAAAPSPTSPPAATMRRPPRGRQPTGSSAAMAMGALPPARP